MMTGKNTLLIVDDEQDILNSLKRLLRKEPYSILLANSGFEALSLIQENPIQAIIADQRMPGMTGVELLEQIRHIDPDSVRIILSGYSDFNAIQDAINRGKIFRFLAKPWNDNEIKEVIASAFEQRYILQENKRIMDQLIQENIRLKNDLSRRENPLIFTKEILDKIDIPLLVLNKSFRVALQNNAAQEFLSSLQIGNQINGGDAKLLTPENPSFIEQCLQKGDDNLCTYNMPEKNDTQLQIRSLRSNDDYSCLLIVKAKE